MKDTVAKKYQFGGGFGIVGNEQLAIDQMRSRNALWNELVALDKVTRSEYNAIVNQDNPAHDRIQAITVEIEHLRDCLLMLRLPLAYKAAFSERLTALRALPRPEAKKVKAALDKDIKKFKAEAEDSVQKAAAETKHTIDTLKKERGDLRPVAKSTAAANKEKFSTEITAFNDKRRIAVNALRIRARSGYTDDRGHTYVSLSDRNTDDVIGYFSTARDKAMKEKATLQFHAFRGVGRTFTRYKVRSTKKHKDILDKYKPELKTLKEQRRAAKDKEIKQQLSDNIKVFETKLQYELRDRCDGLTESEVFTENTLFWLDPVDLKRDTQNPTVWDKTVPRGERRRKMRTTAHVSIGGGQFVSVPVVLHRPFPVDCVIKEAGVNRKKIGNHFRWSVDFTVKYAEKPTAKTGVVAIDLGWSKDSLQDADGRIRVAGVRTRKTDGTETFEEIALPSMFYSSIKKYDDIQSVRDSKTVECFETIAKFPTDEIPLSVREIITEAEKSAQSRKALGKQPPVHHLRKAMWTLRKSGEVCAFAGVLECWYERWNHLNEWLSNGRDNLLAFKKDFYRRTAYRLASNNQTLVMDADNLAKMAKKKDAEALQSKVGRGTVKPEIRQIAAPSMLRDSLEQKFEQSLYATALYSSRTCSKCGHVNEALGAGRTFVCVGCGHTDDRESNATANVIKSFVNNPARFSAKRKVAEVLVEKKEQEAIEIAAAMATV